MQTGGKFLVGSSSGKAPSGCCDPRKAGEFGAENNRVRHRFAGVRHRLAEAGEAAFLSCSMMGDTATGKGPFHARATPQNRAQKKEFSEAIKRRASIAGGHPAGHYVAIVRGESVRNWTHKKGENRRA